MVTVKLCVLDVDYVLEDGQSPVIRIWGKTREGKSVLVLDRGFSPYFYAEPAEGMSLDQLNRLAERLENMEGEEKGLSGRVPAVGEADWSGNRREGVVEKVRPVRVEMDEMRYLASPRKVFRVFARKPADIRKLRDAVKEWGDIRAQYEYAVSFYKRYMIDKGIVPMEWLEVEGEVIEGDEGFRADRVIEAGNLKPVREDSLPPLRVLAFDIETAEDRGTDKVIMVSIMDSRKFSRVLTYKGKRKKGVEVLRDEKAMLERFVKLVKERDPDIVVGYNTDRFDFVKLDARSEALKVDLDLSRDRSRVRFIRKVGVTAAGIRGRIHIDLYTFVDSIMKFYLSTEVLSLDRVSGEILGKKKRQMKWKDIESSWKEGKSLGKLADYCLWDSKLALMLSRALLPQIYELSRVSGMKPFDCSRMRYSSLVEWLLMRRAHEIGELAPGRPKHDEIMRRRKYPAYTGGYVHPPEEGIHKKIALYDFASLYPSITITHNVSPETLNCMCCEEGKCSGKVNKVPEGEHYFCRNHKGFIPAVLEDIVNQRRSVKRRMARAKPGTVRHRMYDNRQNALKILANASYGYYAYAGSRWYSRVCAQSITAWGRFYIKSVIEKAMKEKLMVIYGDTDSLFVSVKTKKSAKEFLKKANGKLPGIMELDLQGIYRSGIFVLAKTGVAAKKRYALMDDEGKITIRGFEIVRRDWSSIAKETQEGVIGAILKDSSPEKAVRIVKKSIERIREGKVGFDDLVTYSQITRPLDKYEQIGPHVAAARKAQERGRVIRPGMSIALIITRGEGSISSRAEPLEDARDYDPEYYIRNQVVPAALRVLAGLGYTEEDLTGEGDGPSQASLKGFFGKER